MTKRKGGIGSKSGKMNSSEQKMALATSATKASLNAIKEAKAEDLYLMQRSSRLYMTVEKQVRPAYYQKGNCSTFIKY